VSEVRRRHEDLRAQRHPPQQCDTCRGIFLDFGELESLTQMENRFVQAAPPPPPPHQGYGDYGPGWGNRGNKHYRKQGFGRLFFSS
jgi:Zn-finger nucleic acid-binding protein